MPSLISRTITLPAAKVRSILAIFSLKRFIGILAIGSTAFIVLLTAIDQMIAYYVKDAIYTDLSRLPYRPYGLLLGTSKYVAKGTPNTFYTNRIYAADTLFKRQKIDYLLLSGDNRTLQYNEPRTMARDLRKLGISDEFLFPDYAGFRTLDSIIRAKEIFRAEPMTIITQRFHCERALFIAKYHNIDAVCFVADSPYSASVTRVRESFARILMLWELFREKRPHFLGSPEPLPPPIQRSTFSQSAEQ
ncbi:ElyC/SanA/YdcF family protein [Bisgaard Taxon 10/6]|uniref:SanA/YdcF family protein n=1 Tax=Exercitatus varius TaxID=67857 RepID=UPI00294B7C34|nr:ElyC/SanA/YdcF family protein [Exercitatus varius]MDG2953146.1 ElyC/SanA/YdcF family protein [Exercitatus varius]